MIKAATILTAFLLILYTLGLINWPMLYVLLPALVVYGAVVFFGAVVAVVFVTVFCFELVKGALNDVRK